MSRSFFGLLLAFLLTASAASAQTIIIRLGGSTRFTAPVHSIEDVKKASTPAYEQDVKAVLEKVGQGSIADKVNQAINEGQVTSAILFKGASIEWMAFRNKGRADVKVNLIYSGANTPGYVFTVTDSGTLYTFFIPEVCGNLMLVAHETVEVQAPPPVVVVVPPPVVVAPPAAVPVPAPPVVVVIPPASVEAPTATVVAGPKRFFVVGLAGRQFRQFATPTREGDLRYYSGEVVYNSIDVIAPGVKLGGYVRLGDNFSVVPAVGYIHNLGDRARSSLFADATLQYYIGKGVSVGGGASFYDVNHRWTHAVTYLGTGDIKLSDKTALTMEWRQIGQPLHAVSYTDPDVNYLFDAGIKISF